MRHDEPASKRPAYEILPGFYERTGLHRYIEGWVLAALLAVAACVWGFLELADEVMDQETMHLDEWILTALRVPGDLHEPIGPWWLKDAALDTNALGGTTVLIYIILLAMGFLWLSGKHHAVWLVLAAAVGGQILNSSMKILFSRPRPDVIPHFADVHTLSFPSGHSMMSAVIYLTMGAVVSQFVTRRRLRLYIIGAALLLTFIIGLCRMYLGVHYLTDVLAGWTAGLAWAMICLIVARILQRRGSVEQPGPE